MSGNIGNLIEVGGDRARRDLYRVANGYSGGDEWHEGKITALGSQITHSADGRVLVEFTDDAVVAPRSGVLALEAAGGPTIVEFRALRLRILDAPKTR